MGRQRSPRARAGSREGVRHRPRPRASAEFLFASRIRPEPNPAARSLACGEGTPLKASPSAPQLPRSLSRALQHAGRLAFPICERILSKYVSHKSLRRPRGHRSARDAGARAPRPARHPRQAEPRRAVDRDAPAAYLLQHQAELLPSMNNGSLERFEQLFARINATLDAPQG